MTKIAINVSDHSVVSPNQFIKSGDKWARYLYSTRMTDFGKSGKVYVKWTESDSHGEYYAHIFNLIVIDTDYINDKEMLEYWENAGLDMGELLKSMDFAIQSNYSEKLHITKLLKDYRQKVDNKCSHSFNNSLFECDNCGSYISTS